MTDKDSELGKIVSGCLNNSRKSQQQLYDLLAPKLFAVCRRYAYSVQEAEDMFMEGFMNIFKSIGSFRSESSFETWAHAVMVNSAIDHIRAHHRLCNEQVVEDLSAYDDLQERESIVTALEAKQVLGLLDQMSENARVVFNLRAVEGYSFGEIARMLDKKEGAIRMVYMRARKWLVEQLKEK